MRESQALYSSLVEQLPAGIFRKDNAGRYVFVNSLFCQFRGVKPEEYLGKLPHELIANAESGTWTKYPDAARLIAAGKQDHESIMQTGRQIESEEPYIRPNGTRQYFHMIKSPILGPGGAIVGSQGFLLDITRRKQAEVELELVHRQLVDASRQAGMAEVATSVLHNVGNVLNSINISLGILTDRARQLQASDTSRVAALLEQNHEDLPQFLARENRGEQLVLYLKKLAGHLTTEQSTMLGELTELAKNVDHIKDIVAMQQNYAKVSGAVETIQVADLVEDALAMHKRALVRHDVRVIREYAPDLPEITLEKHKLMQILINLIHNAKYACDESNQPEKRLTVRITNGNDRVRIALADNGVGILPENLPRIFSYGFTTRKNGHGFGLHSAVLAARELDGVLRVHSDGPGRGATFTVELPTTPKVQTP